MGVALSLKTLAGELWVSRAWTIVAPSVCRFGRVGKGLSMINYYAVAWKVFEHETSSGVQKRTIYSPQMQSFCYVISMCLKVITSRVLTVNAEVGR